jgi:hypothetical protein
MEFKWIWLVDMGCTHLAEGGDRWWPFVNALMSLRFPENSWCFLWLTEPLFFFFFFFWHYNPYMLCGLLHPSSSSSFDTTTPTCGVVFCTLLLLLLTLQPLHVAWSSTPAYSRHFCLREVSSNFSRLASLNHQLLHLSIYSSVVLWYLHPSGTDR